MVTSRNVGRFLRLCVAVNLVYFMHVMKKVVVLGVYRYRCRTLVIEGFI